MSVEMSVEMLVGMSVEMSVGMSVEMSVHSRALLLSSVFRCLLLFLDCGPIQILELGKGWKKKSEWIQWSQARMRTEEGR